MKNMLSQYYRTEVSKHHLRGGVVGLSGRKNRTALPADRLARSCETSASKFSPSSSGKTIFQINKTPSLHKLSDYD